MRPLSIHCLYSTKNHNLVSSWPQIIHDQPASEERYHWFPKACKHPPTCQNEVASNPRPQHLRMTNWMSWACQSPYKRQKFSCYIQDVQATFPSASPNELKANVGPEWFQLDAMCRLNLSAPNKHAILAWCKAWLPMCGIHTTLTAYSWPSSSRNAASSKNAFLPLRMLQISWNRLAQILLTLTSPTPAFIVDVLNCLTYLGDHPS